MTDRATFSRLDALRTQYVATYVLDVQEHPEHFKRRVRDDPRASALAIIDGLGIDEVRQMLRDLRAERRAVAAVSR